MRVNLALIVVKLENLKRGLVDGLFVVAADFFPEIMEDRLNLCIRTQVQRSSDLFQPFPIEELEKELFYFAGGQLDVFAGYSGVGVGNRLDDKMGLDSLHPGFLCKVENLNPLRPDLVIHENFDIFLLHLHV